MSDPSLADVQRWFKSELRRRSCVRIACAADDTLRNASARSMLHPQRGVPGQERLEVYAGGYRARVQEALAEVYETVSHLIGQAAFGELSRAYANGHPSHDYNLSFVGRELSTFLVTYPLTKELPFLPDLARVEWQVCQAFHAFEEPAMDPVRFSSLSLEQWATTRLIFQPSVSVVRSSWPILDLWSARTTPREQINIDLVNRPQSVLIFRQALQVRCELITPAQQQLLQGLLDGQTLGEVCGAMATQVHGTPPPLAEWFSQWVHQGLITRCEAS